MWQRKSKTFGEFVMRINLSSKLLAAALLVSAAPWIVASVAAAPISSSLGLQNAVPTSVETVQYRRGWGGSYRGGYGYRRGYGYRGGYYGGGVVAGAIIGGALLGAAQPYGYYGYNGYGAGYAYAPGYYQPNYYGSPAYPRYYGPYQQCTYENAGRADMGC
jgi:hypothetical protein